MHRVGRRCPGCSEFAANISRGARPHSPNAQSIPGTAAGVTERLWEVGDIVDVLEAWEQVRVGHVVLSTKVQYYLERAEHCERMAALTSNREVRANFAELAQQRAPISGGRPCRPGPRSRHRAERDSARRARSRS